MTTILRKSEEERDRGPYLTLMERSMNKHFKKSYLHGVKLKQYYICNGNRKRAQCTDRSEKQGSCKTFNSAF